MWLLGGSGGAVCGRVGVVRRKLAEAGADGVAMDVVSVDFEVFVVADAVVGEAFLPDGVFVSEAVGEAALDEHEGSFEGDVLWGEEEMDVIGHGDEGVEFVVTFMTIVLEGLEE